jgi:hypothetical protein
MGIETEDPDGGLTEPSYAPDDEEGEITAESSAGAEPPLAPSDRSADDLDVATAKRAAVSTVTGAHPAPADPLPFRKLPTPSAPAMPGGRAPSRPPRMPSASSPGRGAPPVGFATADDTVALEPRSPEQADPLPFRRPPSLQPPRPSPRPAAPAPRDAPAARPAIVRQIALQPVAAPVGPASPWAAGGTAAELRAGPLRPASAPEPVDDAAPVLKEPPKPPEYLGPLATPDMLARGESTAELPAAGAEQPAASPDGPSAEADERSEGEEYLWVEGSFKLLRIDACAALAASLARRPDESARILEENSLTLPVWKANEVYWGQVLREETAKGRTKLRRVYDTAFVTRLELERGAINVDEYAGLLVAAESGKITPALRKLDLPQGSMARIERVFLRRVVENPSLGDKVRKAVEALRGT